MIAKMPFRRLAAFALASAAGFAAPVTVPVFFEPNLGQAPAGVRFVSRASGLTAYVSENGVGFAISRRTNAPQPGGRRRHPVMEESAVRMVIDGARDNATAEGLDRLGGVSHYFPSQDRRTWRTRVPHFARMKVAAVYPGIDLVVYSLDGQIEYDFVVAPGADPASIRLRYEGASHMRLSDAGDLVLSTALGDLRQIRPRVYQEIAGRRIEVESRYRISHGRLGFELARYDRTKPVVIDPVIVWSSFLGGGAADSAAGVTVDAQGNSYVAGFTRSANFPVRVPVQGVLLGSVTAFAAKINAGGSAIEWATYIGTDSQATGIAVDSSGNAHVAGTVAGAFPVLNPYQGLRGGGTDGFIAKLSPSGSALIYSSYLGGTDEDTPSGVALDAAGNAYVGGITDSVDFPVLNAYQRQGAPAAFVTKFLAAGSQIGYSTKLLYPDALYSNVAVGADQAGGAYLAGRSSASIPTTASSYQQNVAGGTDAFLVKFNPHSTGNLTVGYATYLGGAGEDYATAVSIAGSGESILVAGNTTSANFPLRLAAQSTPGGGWDGFVVRLSVFNLISSTYFGGTLDDFINAGAIAAGRESFVAGQTVSTNLPAKANEKHNGLDAFVARFSEAGNAILYSMYLGGNGDDLANAIAVDSGSVAHVAGQTAALDYPQVSPVQNFGGVNDAFLARISPCDTIAANPRTITASASAAGYNINFAADSACAWRAVSAAPWITFGSATQGTGGATVNLLAATNDGPARTGTASIGGVGITVQQNSGLPTGGLGLASPNITTPGANQIVAVSGVTFRWDPVGGADSYDLRLFDAATNGVLFNGGLLGGNAVSTLISLPRGEYVFAVRACSGGLTAATCGSYATRLFRVDPASPLASPQVDQPVEGAQLTSSTVTFSWSAVAGAVRYEVLLEDVQAGTAELQLSTAGLGTVYSLGGSNQYRFVVRACTAGCGPWSAPVRFSVQLPQVPQTAPRISPNPAVANGNQVTVSYNSVQGADLYRVLLVQPNTGPGGGALTVAANTTAQTSITLPAPAGAASAFVAACNGNGCSANSQAAPVNVPGPNPAAPVLGSPISGQTVNGPVVFFSWNRVPGDNGSNTIYRLYVQDLLRQAAALDVLTTSNFHAAYLKAEGTRYDALVIANPGGSAVAGPAAGFNVRGTSATAPTMVAPTHDGTAVAGNVTLGWSPVAGANLYQYYVSMQGQNTTVTGVTPGLLVQVPLPLLNGGPAPYSAIVRACPAASTCAAGSDAGWGPWSNLGGPGVTNFTAIP